jgi:DNA-binding PadR family transcriptional regulator
MTVLRAMFNGGASREYHGYELAKQLRSHQSAYAIFRKLEALDLVTSRWEEVDGRRRRYYKLTGDGIDYCLHLFDNPGDGTNPAWSPA